MKPMVIWALCAKFVAFAWKSGFRAGRLAERMGWKA